MRLEDGGRALIFATDEQLELLKSAREWYADGTFGLVRRPFYQLYSIHAFIVNEDNLREQAPLAFIIMSAKTKSQYKEVMKT